MQPQKRLLITVPGPPSVWEVKEETTSNAFKVQWNETATPNGKIVNHKVVIYFSFDIISPSRCENVSVYLNDTIIPADETNDYKFDKAFPFASYFVQVITKNGEASSAPSSTVIIRTSPGMKKERSA